MIMENMIQIICYFTDLLNIGHRTTSYQGFFPLLGFVQISKTLGRFIGMLWKQYTKRKDDEKKANYLC